MLAPVSELHYREEGLFRLTAESAALYPQFVEPLEARGFSTGYRQDGTLVVAVDAADRQSLADLAVLQRALGRDVEELTTRAARREEPMLGPAVTGAFRIPADHQVDPRRLAAALLGALRETADVVPVAVAGLVPGGVALADGSTMDADEVVVANGLGAAALGGLPVELPLRPVYGDILRLRVPERLRPLLNATVRGVVRGFPVYLVPRDDGTVVIGATQREDGNSAISAGGVYQLLRDAQQLVPAVAELELLQATCGARPGTPDNAPLLGRAADGVIIATGFFRHGVLLAPLAARIAADLIDGGTPHPDYSLVSPNRFAGGTA
jgi:glycine oxidase